MQTPPPGPRLLVARCLCPRLCPGLPSSGGASRPGSESTPADVIERGYYCDSVSPPKVALWGPGGRDSGSSFSGDSTAPHQVHLPCQCAVSAASRLSAPRAGTHVHSALCCVPRASCRTWHSAGAGADAKTRRGPRFPLRRKQQLSECMRRAWCRWPRLKLFCCSPLRHPPPGSLAWFQRGHLSSGPVQVDTKR